ncbi:MAG: CPBP family intramembrane metalloprotease [Thermoanaerobacteraceae bacterium]|nr:CPBP family intramembrane metalloprotease [Thermoanaerobacteraceae bacterium]
MYVIKVRYGSYRLAFRKAVINTVIGIAAGVLLFVVAEGLEYFLGQFFVVDSNTHPLVRLASRAQSFRQFVLPFFIGAVLAPVSEELYYRGLAYPVFKKKWGLVLGLTVNALFFAVFHFQTVWFLEILVVAFALGLLYELTGSLWPLIVAHGMVNGARLMLIYFGS